MPAAAVIDRRISYETFRVWLVERAGAEPLKLSVAFDRTGAEGPRLLFEASFGAEVGRDALVRALQGRPPHGWGRPRIEAIAGDPEGPSVRGTLLPMPAVVRRTAILGR